MSFIWAESPENVHISADIDIDATLVKCLHCQAI